MWSMRTTSVIWATWSGGTRIQVLKAAISLPRTFLPGTLRMYSQGSRSGSTGDASMKFAAMGRSQANLQSFLRSTVDSSAAF